MCQTCGHVGCCGDSAGQHATVHHHATDHPLVRSFEPDEEWLWCFEDQISSTSKLSPTYRSHNVRHEPELHTGTTKTSQRDGVVKCDCEWLAAIRKCLLNRPDMERTTVERTTGFEPATLTLARLWLTSAESAALP
jgi:Zn-finger in ubiquitin-hydrolases and other protein